MELFYLSEAKTWNEALPVGNGFIGGMIFGGIKSEKISLNDDSLWSGGKKNRHNPDAFKNLPEIRKLIFEGRIKEAQRLTNLAMFCSNPHPSHYEPLGDLRIRFWYPDGDIINYRRSLDLNTAVSSVLFEAGGVAYTRETFVSYPDKAMVLHMTAERPGSISFEIEFDRGRNLDCIKADSGCIVAEGKSIGINGVSFCAAYKLVTEGGRVEVIGETLVCREADAATLILCTGTSARGESFKKTCRERLDIAASKKYKQLKTRHVKDYQKYFSRVDLSFGGNDDKAHVPTDKRIELLRNGETDNSLFALYFQFGRYLLISSSRPGSLAANLQGIWNKDMLPPWGSKYTININTQMNYWLAENCNLPEMHEPLFRLIDRMKESGRETAEKMYNCRGFTAHHNTDAFGDTAPVDKYMPATIWQTGVAWLCTHIWEHYLYTCDNVFLSEHYDTLREACLFFVDFLIEDEKGRLVTSPSVSPENTYILPNGEQGVLCYAPSMDSQILHLLFTAFLQSCAILSKKDELEAVIRDIVEKLPKPEIGRYGQLMEWAEDYEEKEAGHRHISHLFALYPSNQISVYKTPELAEAARKTLERRLANGGGHTGWSRAWIINLWARLLDGKKVYENLKALLVSSTLPNLLDNHPPFQIDGNFGGTAGIAEMLMQSHNEEIDILPALPEEFPDGYVSGLCARGGFEVDIRWKGGLLEKLVILSKSGRSCRVKINKNVLKNGIDEEINIIMEKGEKCTLVFDGSIKTLKESGTKNKFAGTSTASDDGTFTNPVVNADVPDPDIIRVGDAFYMTSTSMHFTPGIPVMRSYDLVNWEIVNYVYHIFEDNDEMRLINGKDEYGRGSWATSLTQNNGTFYVSFACNTTQRTYFYRTTDIENGIWTKNVIDKWFHDGSVLFDSDGTPYMIYGSGSISAVKLNDDLTGIAEGASPVKIIPNANDIIDNNTFIEATHAYKVGEYYYIFFCVWPSDGTKTQLVYRSKELLNPNAYEGRVLLLDCMDKTTGAGQGGIIDMSDGSWYGFVMHDRSAVGRGLTIFPIDFVEGWPVFGEGNLKVPVLLDIPVKKGSEKKSIVESYDFAQGAVRPSYTYSHLKDPENEAGAYQYNGSNLKLGWEWNHNPDNRFWSLTDRPGYLRLTNGSLSENLTKAKNVLTQRTYAPQCAGCVVMDISSMKNGDVAGFAAFQRKYAYIGVKKENDRKYIVYRKITQLNKGFDRENYNKAHFDNSDPWTEVFILPLEQDTVHLKIEFDYTSRSDKAYFYYSLDGKQWGKVGEPLQMRYSFPKHFTGYRFALFNFAQKEVGGFVDFSDFKMTDEFFLPPPPAVNPFLPLWEYIPDGEPYVFEDPDNPGKYRAYIYGSHDVIVTGYCGRDQVVWSAPAEDLSNWRCDGTVFVSDKNRDGEAFDKADILFAPDIAEIIGENGEKTYYFYPNTQARGRNSMVAKSNRPDGPFEVCNWSLSDSERTIGIMGFDPCVFVDDDGRVYGYWGFQASYAAELDPVTMSTIKPGTSQIDHMIPNQKMDDDGQDPQHFRFYEASSMRKIGGKYIFVYSRKGRADERYGVVNSLLAYAYADTPLGPWTYGGVIIDNAKELGSAATSNNTHNNHGSICEINGQWYIFYHRCTNNHGYSRQACVEAVDIKLNQDGSVYISEVEPTSQGFSLNGMNPYVKYSAGIACYLTGGAWIKANRDCMANSNTVVNTKNNSVVGYKFFNFGSETEKLCKLRINLEIIPSGIDGEIDIYLDRPNTSEGKLLGTISVTADMRKFPIRVSTPVTHTGLVADSLCGKHAVYFGFRSGAEDKQICELISFEFSMESHTTLR